MTNTRRIAANGLEFMAIEAGDGPLVLLLHGFPDHHLSWMQMVETLAAQGLHAVAPAMRGFAPSGPDPMAAINHGRQVPTRSRSSTHSATTTRL